MLAFSVVSVVSRWSVSKPPDVGRFQRTRTGAVVAETFTHDVTETRDSQHVHVAGDALARRRGTTVRHDQQQSPATPSSDSVKTCWLAWSWLVGTA